MVNVTMQYLQERRSKKLGSLSYRYRRVVDQRLREHLGRGEVTIPLGKTLGAATKAYGGVHKRVEKLLADTWEAVNAGPAGTVEPEKTIRELFQNALDRARDLGVNPYRHEDDEASHDPEAAEIIADNIANKYRPGYRAAGGAYAIAIDPTASGDPADVSKADAALLRVLMSTNPKAPPVTLVDAKKRYVEDRFMELDPKPLEKKKIEQRAERAVNAIVQAVGRMPTVASITREEARKVQAYLKGKVQAQASLKGKVSSLATVDRYLNDIRAIITHAITEFDDLHGLTNHFVGLPDLAGGRNGGIKPQEEGRALTDDERTAIRSRIANTARHGDLILIWRMLEGTGCRLGEVVGLRSADVIVEGEMPYIEVEWHEERRVKTLPSRRRVPLIGDALDAAKEALGLSNGTQMLFPRYGREGGPGAASQILMKHVRKVSDDPKAVNHSLRHNMKDTLIVGGVDHYDQNLILGHTLGGEGERYGGPEARLVAATRAMKKALGL